MRFFFLIEDKVKDIVLLATKAPFAGFVYVESGDAEPSDRLLHMLGNSQ